MHSARKSVFFTSALFFAFAKMLDFIYDSLETVKKLKFPTVKQIIQMTTAIFALVIIAGLYFILADTIFSGGYKAFYNMMMGDKAMSENTLQTGQKGTFEL